MSANLKIIGIQQLTDALKDIAPELRRGPALRALRLGAAPVLDRAKTETPALSRPIFSRGKLIRRPGTMRNSLRVRVSKDETKNGNVGVFINYKPLSGQQITKFKLDTARKGSENPDDNYYWRWVIFATKRNKNPKPALQNAGKLLEPTSLPIILRSLVNYFNRLNSKAKS